MTDHDESGEARAPAAAEPPFPSGPDGVRAQPPAAVADAWRRTVLPGRPTLSADGSVSREPASDGSTAEPVPAGSGVPHPAGPFGSVPAAPRWSERGGPVAAAEAHSPQPGGAPGDTGAASRSDADPDATQSDPRVPERLHPSPGIPPRPEARQPGPMHAGPAYPAASPPPAAPPASVPTDRPSPSPAYGTGTRPATAVRRGPRRARLTVRRVDPWSVMKFTLVYSTALLIVFVVAVVALYGVLSAMGVFNSINSFLRDVSGSTGTLTSYVSFWRVVGGTILIGAVNVVLFTAFATLGAFVYNLCADLVGGVELTLSERE